MKRLIRARTQPVPIVLGVGSVALLLLLSLLAAASDGQVDMASRSYLILDKCIDSQTELVCAVFRSQMESLG